MSTMTSAQPGDSGSGWIASFHPVATTHTPTDPTNTNAQQIGYDATFSDDGNSLPTDTGSSGSNSGGNSSNGGLATSAALYLYTFLATLVLLLAISAAIVTRSYIIRRRNRRMIEEAIRNGTWVPPPPPDWEGRGRVKVDLSKKPQMWEAFIGEEVSEKEKVQAEYLQNPAGDGQIIINSTWRTGGRWMRWSSIWPFAASYVVPPGSTEASGANVIEAEFSDGGGVLRRRRLRMPVPPPRAMFSRIASALGTSNTPTEAGDMTPKNSIPMNNLYNHRKHLASMTSPTPMKVAVLIKMPTPPSPPNTSRSSSQTASGSNSLLTVPTLSTATHTQHEEEEEVPLPHIELGVAEVILLPRWRPEDDDEESMDEGESDITERTRGSRSLEG
ncbi:hypothetical protein CPB83DRAFT_301078 [Crepidotus variabilis]|uniref:Uncharacterized protein n=1 Tax=Crepidotus variabilis TaxID=179855 RepID=A0A9P6EH98_9AGAR|nr:hypothetical protein CPB83DRAFT_301078 [Crepidotus variabilis]